MKAPALALLTLSLTTSCVSTGARSFSLGTDRLGKVTAGILEAAQNREQLGFEAAGFGRKVGASINFQRLQQPSRVEPVSADADSPKSR